MQTQQHKVRKLNDSCVSPMSLVGARKILTLLLSPQTPITWKEN